MKIRKCSNHSPAVYTLKEICPRCKKETKGAHYKFIKLGNASDSHNYEKSSRQPKNTSREVKLPSR